MKHAALSLACLGLLAPMLSATSIEFKGVESGVAVKNWSNTAVAKTHDLNGDDRFGGAGYYQIMPAVINPNTNTDNIGLTAPPNNDLGISVDISGAPLGTLNTDYLTPEFLSGIPAGAAGQFINNTNFPEYSDVSGTAMIRQGSIWLSQANIIEAVITPGGSANSNTAFSFTLSQAANFRFGLAVDTMSDLDVAPDYVSVINLDTSHEVFSTALTRDGNSDMVFFDIAGVAGNQFVVKLWSFDYVRTAFALVTFDQLPTSTPIPTLTYTQNGDSITLSWEANITGWILESSTALGVGDDWDTPIDLDNDNSDNSVTVSTTGVPKNFFRLKKSP